MFFSFVQRLIPHNTKETLYCGVLLHFLYPRIRLQIFRILCTFCRREVVVNGKWNLILSPVHIDTVKVVINALQALWDGNYTCKSTQDSGHFGVINVGRDFLSSVIMRHMLQNMKGEPFRVTCAIKDLKVNEGGRCIMFSINQKIICFRCEAK